jgi:hypothetical protein
MEHHYYVFLPKKMLNHIILLIKPPINSLFFIPFTKINPPIFQIFFRRTIKIIPQIDTSTIIPYIEPMMIIMK